MLMKLTHKYQLVQLFFREWKMQREKIDFLLALGEKLCRLSGTESTEHLARVTSGDSRESPTVDRRWDEAPEEYLSIIANMVNEI